MTLEERAEKQFETHPDLQVLFFFDPEEKQRSEVEGWGHESIQCVVANGARFRLRYRLEQKLGEEKVFLYLSERRPTDWETDPLADLWFANRELRIDREGEFMDEYQLPARYRDLVQEFFGGELEHKGRQRFLSSILQPDRFEEESLKRGLAAYHAKETFEHVGFQTVPKEDQLLAAILTGAAEPEAFDEYQEVCEELGLAGDLGRRLSQQFELDTTDLTYEAVETAAHKMKYNLLMRPVDAVRSEDKYRKLKIQSTLVLNQLESMKAAWEENGALEQSPEEVLDRVAAGVDETHLLEVYGPDVTFGYLTPALRQRRITQALSEVKRKPSEAKSSVGELRAVDGAIGRAAEVVWHVSSFYQVLRGYRSMDVGDLRAFVTEYSDDLHRADTAYRKAVGAYRRFRDTGVGPVDAIGDVYGQFLHDYHEEFVHPLNKAWQEELEADPDAVQSLPFDRQGHFYDEYLADETQKTAVIISDALRYEVAQELSSRMLQRDSRKQTSLDPMLAALPSVTSVGQAHLLPHDRIHLEGDTPYNDGQSTQGTRNRNKILQAARESPVCARTYKDLKGLSQREGRDLFQEYPLVYVYHDHIDAIGDDSKTEEKVIPAVDEAIQDLQQLVRTLNNWNVYQVLLVADHGFLYMENDPPDAMQESFPEVEGRVFRCNRSIVSKSSTGEGGYRFPLRSVSDIDEDLEVRVPRAVNRYHLQGAGKRYAHGGASLQEMLVPVLTVHKAREDKAEKVGARLLSKERVIRSGFLNVEVLQTEAVSSTRQPRTLLVGLYDNDDELISQEKTVALDSTEEEASGRTQGLKLTLGNQSDGVNFCYLRAYDEEDHDKLNPVIEQRYSVKRLIEPDF
jgi:uncharacterized protein (TIGR02687 family)